MKPTPANAIQWWDDAVAQWAERTYLIDGSNNQRWTYAEFDRGVQDLAVQLMDLGVTPGDQVVTSLQNGPELVCLYFACLRLRAIVVPVNRSASTSNSAHILKTCSPRVVVFDDSTENLFHSREPSTAALRVVPGVGTDGSSDQWSLTRNVWRSLTPARMAGIRAEDASADDAWLITFTSGSTSQPKAIVHRALGMLACAEAFNRVAGIDSGTRLYHVFSMTYMAGILNTLVCPFIAGATVVLGDEFDARSALSFWRAPMSHEINTFWVAPTVLQVLLKLDREPRAAAYCKEHVRAFHVGTAPLPATLKEEFETRFNTRILESYGLTEVLFVTTNRPSGPRLAGSVGQTIPGVELKIVDNRGNEVAPGQEGEIRIRAAHAMVGYLGVTRSFEDGVFVSGDLGKLSPDGMLSITGRKKDLIIRGGFNISPREIEEVLLQHAAVDCVAVLGTPHEFYGEEVSAVVQLAHGTVLEEIQPELVEFCRQRLSSICVPTRFIAVEKLPVTVTGKVKKGEVRELLESLPRAA